MGASTSQLPPVDPPKHYTKPISILGDAFYKPHFKFNVIEGEEKEVEKEGKPLQVMANFFKMTDPTSDSHRLSILLDQRMRLNGENCLRLLDHGRSPNKELYVAYWEAPNYTLERECTERRGSILDYMRVTKVKYILLVLQ